ncbi:MAG TPA: response regulator [Bryobacteraceae bacterium]|nr:response regulator [Bryobacteraceae bacterium]
MTNKAADILLVEDNPSDARFTQVALEELRIFNNVSVVTNGEQALDYLYKRKKYEQASRPDLILLDWNLPGVDGSEVLQIIRDDEDLTKIPVVVLTGSRAQIDVLKAFHLRANCYITKPVDLDGLTTILDACDFGMTIVKRVPKASTSGI